MAEEKEEGEDVCSLRGDRAVKRVMLTVAYDGTNYSGWQLQPGAATIEGALNRSIFELTGESLEVIGASRTDAGVHALGNIAVFDTKSAIPAERFSYALNQRLPEDIRVRASVEVAPDFHPRRCDSRKTYEYRICCAPFPLPTRRLYAHFTYAPLNVDLMSQGAAFLVGIHDFKSFCNVKTQAETTVRQVEAVEVWEEAIVRRKEALREKVFVCEGAAQMREEDFLRGEAEAGGEAFLCTEAAGGHGADFGGGAREIVLRVTGRGFLYHMVRIIAGTLMEVGRGKILPGRVQEILQACDRQAAGPTAPACGLTLVGYEFLSGI